MKKLFVIVSAMLSIVVGEVTGDGAACYIKIDNKLNQSFSCTYNYVEGVEGPHGEIDNANITTTPIIIAAANEPFYNKSKETWDNLSLDVPCSYINFVRCTINMEGYVGTQTINPKKVSFDDNQKLYIDILPATFDPTNLTDWFWLKQQDGDLARGAESGNAVQIMKAAPKFEQAWRYGISFDQIGRKKSNSVTVRNSTSHEIKCTYIYQTGFYQTGGELGFVISGPYSPRATRNMATRKEFKVGGPGNPTVFEESLDDGARFESITCALPNGTSKTFYNYDQDRGQSSATRQFEFIYSEPAGYVLPGASK